MIRAPGAHAPAVMPEVTGTSGRLGDGDAQGHAHTQNQLKEGLLGERQAASQAHGPIISSPSAGKRANIIFLKCAYLHV